MVTRLNRLKPGDTAIIVRINGNGTLKRRIMDLGMVCGAKVQLQKFAPLGDPLEIKVKNFNLSLRNAEAELLEVELVSATAKGNSE